jgi:hypothetical protein
LHKDVRVDENDWGKSRKEGLFQVLTYHHWCAIPRIISRLPTRKKKSMVTLEVLAIIENSNTSGGGSAHSAPTTVSHLPDLLAVP